MALIPLETRSGIAALTFAAAMVPLLAPGAFATSFEQTNLVAGRRRAGALMRGNCNMLRAALDRRSERGRESLIHRKQPLARPASVLFISGLRLADFRPMPHATRFARRSLAGVPLGNSARSGEPKPGSRQFDRARRQAA
jgi:hypothetical protein